MPEIFQKNCKLKVIEYGAAENPGEFLEDIKTALYNCVKWLRA